MNVADKNTKKLIANSQISRELSQLFTNIDILGNTFYGRDDFLKSKGHNIIAIADDIATRSTDPALKSSIVDLHHTFHKFFRQCVIVNKVIYDTEAIANGAHNDVTKLEDIISELLLKFTLEGKSTSFIEQQLALSVGYRESILEIEKLHAKLGYDHYAKKLEYHSHPIVIAIDDLLLRLQTINASIPIIAQQGQQISNRIQRYKETTLELHSVLAELKKNKAALHHSKDLSITVMENVERSITDSTHLTRNDIEKIVLMSCLTIFFFSSIVIALLVFSSRYMLMFIINKPIEAILTGIESFRQGQLDSKICLNRNDEWGAIEESFNKMAADLRQSYTALEESETRFRELSKLLPQIVFETDKHANLTFFNEIAYRITGYSEEDLSHGVNALQLLVPEDCERAAKIFNAIIQGGPTSSDNEYSVMGKNGSHIPVLIYSNPITHDGEIVGVRGIVVDISERKLVEEATRESETFLDSVIENIPNMIFVKDAHDLTFVRLNRAGEELLGYPKEDFIGKNDFDFFPKEEAEFFTVKDREVLNNKHMLDIPEEFIETKSKGSRILHTKKIPVLTEDGNPRFLLGISEDITERKHAEEKLKEYANTQTILLREVNHRVTNNLTAIISMFHMAEDRAKEQRMTTEISLLQEVAGRVKGLLTVHSLLSATGWQPLSLSSLCEKITKDVFKGTLGTRKHKIEISGTAVYVDSDQAHQLTLVLNELATNSIKYALSENEYAYVDIDISTQDDSVRLSYRDNGAGFPATILEGKIPKACMGLNLIRGIVERSLRGKLEVCNNNGAQTVITFPAMDDTT